MTTNESPGDASVAHLRETNAILRDRLREQQARIEALDAQVRRERTAAAEADGGDTPQEQFSESVIHLDW
ncbi:MAG: hypothetical protein ABEI86_00615 [Halobacteriaceae archaeon]